MGQVKVERHLALGEPYSPIMGDPSPDSRPYWHTLGAQVREAEKLGYDSVVMPEIQYDPFLVLAVAAQEPARIELATGIALAFPRSPTTVAYSAWDLQRMSAGRFVLGLGSQVKGHIERRFGIPWLPAARRMKEYVGALRAVWQCWQDGTPLRYDGEIYRLSLMTPTFAPPPQESRHAFIPIHVAAVNPAMLRVAGEVADGVRLHGIVTRRYIDEIALPNLAAGAERAGRSLDGFEIGGGAFLVTGKDQGALAKAFEQARKTIAFYGSTRTYRVSFDLEGWADKNEKLHALSLRGKWSEMASMVTEEMVDAFCVIGTYEQIADRMKARLAGCTRLAFDTATRTDEERGICREIVQDLHRTG